MEQLFKIEIKGKDEFWGRAFHVEWEDQFPERGLMADGANRFIAQSDWLEDLVRVGSETHCKVVRAPENPPRREWLSSIIAGRSDS